MGGLGVRLNLGEEGERRPRVHNKAEAVDLLKKVRNEFANGYIESLQGEEGLGRKTRSS